MATFSQYAVAAAEEALKDSGWRPGSNEQQERTVGHSLVKICKTPKTDAWGNRAYV